MRQQLPSLYPGLRADIERGLREISREHARVFSLVGKFIALARSGTEAPLLLAFLDQVIEQTLTHCRNEENVLRRLGHPSLATQCEAHRSIMEELFNSREGMLAGRGMISNDYYHVLDSLIVHHIREGPGYVGLDELAA